MKKTELKGADAEHPASGTILIENGVIKLQDVQISEAPDGRVVLAKDLDESTGVKIAPLKSFTGSHEYPIPEGVDPADYNSVVIWCDQFSVPIGLAQFED